MTFTNSILILDKFIENVIRSSCGQAVKRVAQSVVACQPMQLFDGLWW